VRPFPSDRFKRIHITRDFIKKIIPISRFKSCFVTRLMPYGITATIYISINKKENEAP
jgi:hypothetical protein